MSEYLSTVFLWILLMVLIGIALWLTPMVSKRKDSSKKDSAQDIADE